MESSSSPESSSQSSLPYSTEVGRNERLPVSVVQVLTARRLAVTWQNPTTRCTSLIALLEFDGDVYHFHYVANAEATEGFRALPGFPDLHRSYESVHLFPLFAQRVMDPRRPDYVRYVERLGLPSDATPWEQMSRSGGAREGDLLQLFPEPTIENDKITCTFLVHGIRHISESEFVVDGQRVRVDPDELERQLASLHQGDRLRLLREPGNPVNSQAVLTTADDGVPLGWVPDLLLDDLYAMSNGEPEATAVNVEQINGPDAPPHIRLLARLKVQRNLLYIPFSGQRWEPLG